MSLATALQRLKSLWARPKSTAKVPYTTRGSVRRSFCIQSSTSMSNLARARRLLDTNSARSRATR
eukprot:scaffold173471_cov37-Prasinocladus_malaysianus.AAC.1